MYVCDSRSCCNRTHFKDIDADSSKLISLVEFETYLHAIATHHFTKADANKDAKLSYDEFLTVHSEL